MSKKYDSVLVDNTNILVYYLTITPIQRYRNHGIEHVTHHQIQTQAKHFSIAFAIIDQIKE